MRFLILILMFLSIFADASTIPQKLADTPRDQAIKVRLHDGSIYCYSPILYKGRGWVYIDYCSKSLPGRYDVLSRVSWKINNIHVCMTAPSSVTGIDGKSTKSNDYLELRPCAINDKNQRWIVKDYGLTTFDGRFRIKDKGFYAFISKNEKDLYNHRLYDMDRWLNTIAQPGTLTIRTPLAWLFVDPTQWGLYYLQNNRSYADVPMQLYYNPENGHLGQYNSDKGNITCLTTEQGARGMWAWASWKPCNDNDARINQRWKFQILNDNEGYFQDGYGNFLRVTQYGPNWGVPYTASLKYLLKDSTNAPKSNFIFDHFVDTWSRYVNGNLGDNNEYCPAPGREHVSESSRTKRSLPPSFQLTDAWIQRLHQIATTTSGGHEVIGLCGTCLLQSYQMLAELHRYQFTAPLTGGGYFFNTHFGGEPFSSFRSRFPLLANSLESTMSYWNLPMQRGESDQSRRRRGYYAMSITMLPELDFRSNELAFSQADINRILGHTLNAPVGTTYLLFLSRSNAQGSGTVSHALPLLRTAEGVVPIATNTFHAQLDSYRQALRPVTTVEELRNRITVGGTRTLYGITLFQVADRHEAPLSVFLSNSNCTGSGDHRRGNLHFPTARSVNQCSSGRCLIQ